MESNLFDHRPMIEIAKWSIVLMIIIIPIQILVFALSPIPDTAVGMIELFIERPILGLIHMDLLYVINNTLLIFFYVVLYITLKKENKNSWLHVAMITGMIGIVLYYSNNRSIEMLYVSRRYAETVNPIFRD